MSLLLQSNSHQNGAMWQLNSDWKMTGNRAKINHAKRIASIVYCSVACKQHEKASGEDWYKGDWPSHVHWGHLRIPHFERQLQILTLHFAYAAWMPLM